MADEKDYPTHQIHTLEDLGEVITKENADMLIGNLYLMCIRFLEVKEKHPGLKLQGMTWIDDGKIELKEVKVVSERFKMDVKEERHKSDK